VLILENRLLIRKDECEWMSARANLRKIN
jgi:hypothetical protein